MTFNDMVAKQRNKNNGIVKEQSQYGLTHEDYMRDKDEFIGDHWDEIQSDWHEEHNVDGWESKKCETLWYGNGKHTFYHYIFTKPYYETSYYGQDVQKGWKRIHEWFSTEHPASKFYEEIVM